MARAAYLKHDADGYPLSDRTKNIIFPRQAKIPGHMENHGSRNFSDLFDTIQILVRKPMNQVSSSFPYHVDEWDDSINLSEYYNIDERIQSVSKLDRMQSSSKKHFQLFVFPKVVRLKTDEVEKVYMSP